MTLFWKSRPWLPRRFSMIAFLFIGCLALGDCGTIGTWVSGGHQRTFGGIITDAEMISGVEYCIINQNEKHRRVTTAFIAPVFGILDMPLSFVLDLLLLPVALILDSADNAPPTR